jgi:hypothetical protein
MNVVIISIAALGLLFWFLSLSRLRRRRWFAAGGHGLTGGVMLGIAATLGAVAINLHTYQRFTHEQPVAELGFKRLAPHRFQATLTYPSGRHATFVVSGDEWQLDARILKWTGMATLMGMDTRFRLERLSGRFDSLQRERNEPRSVYSLAPEAGLDLWSLVQRYEPWMPWVDATYGAATYLPMADDAIFGVHVTTSGLIGRPLNGSARAAVKRW